MIVQLPNWMRVISVFRIIFLDGTEAYSSFWESSKSILAMDDFISLFNPKFI